MYWTVLEGEYDWLDSSGRRIEDGLDVAERRIR
jgi:hypothetical protein